MTTHPLRDSRLNEIAWLGPQGLATLRSRRVAVLGVGNIGGEAARHLAMLGIPMLLVDRGIVEPANLGTQGFIEEDIGLPKVQARRRALHRMNSDCSIDALALDIETMGFAALRSAGLWLCCLDSLRLRARINEMSLRLGIPWIDAAIDGAGHLFAKVTAYDARPESPCFLCGYGQEGFQELMRQGTATPCPPLEGATPDAPPTHAVSAMGSLAASIQVLWAMRFGLGQLPHQGDHEVLFNLDAPQCRSLRRSRDPRCVIAHDRWPLTSGLHQGHRLDEAFRLAERILGSDIVLTLVHRSLVTETGWLDRMSRAEAADFLDQPLHQLGIPADDILIAQGRTNNCFLLGYLLIAGAPEAPSNVSHPQQQPEREAPHGSSV